MKISSKMERCELSPILKFAPLAEEAENRGLKIYHLNIGQPDVATPAAYYKALKEYDDPIISYNPSAGMPVLTDSVRSYYSRIGVELERDDILVTDGGSEAIQIAMSIILEDGDELVIPEPFYSNYLTPIVLAGATVRPVQTFVEEGYFYADRERIEACINEHTRAIMITNPGNPTGTVLSPDQLKMVLDIAKEHDIFVVCDEVYREFSYGGEPLLSALQFEGYEENVVVIDSVSKRFSACGARIGMLISKNRYFMSQALKWCQCRICCPSVDQVASAALFALDPSYFDEVREEYIRRRDTLIRKLKSVPDVVCNYVPGGAFYVMAALPVDDADKFQTWLLTDFNDNNETLLLSCGENFYATPGRGRNEIRMAYTINCDDISRGIDLLAIALEKYKNR